MANPIEVIEKVISQHSKITDNAKQTLGSANDIDAIFNLQTTKVQAAWSATSAKGIIEKQDQLLQTMTLLDNGLKKHFSYEEEVLPLVFGKLLIKPVLEEHKKIIDRIETVKNDLINLKELSHEEVFARRHDLLQSINDIYRMVEDHAHHEETILNSMKKALEEDTAYWN